MSLPEEEPKRQISPERQGVYYLGMGMMVVGVLLFVGGIFSGAMSVQNRMGGGLGGQNKVIDLGGGKKIDLGSGVVSVGGGVMSGGRDGPPVGLFVAGFVMFAVGGILMGVGSRGLAGSGVILDPQQARRDLEPHSRAAGGMLSDALDEVPQLGGGAVREVVKVRCGGCQALNEERAKFCSQCGKAM